MEDTTSYPNVHTEADAEVATVEKFVATEFEKHPHFSFNDWHVMYDHSVRVRDLALQIAEDLSVDKTVVAIGALLHDIGKTHEADAETLHTKHESFNLPVSKQLLDSLSITPEQRNKLEGILQHTSESKEMEIIEDADALALYSDKHLYTLFIEWARTNNLDVAIKRKIDKFDKLHFEKSREIGKPWLEQMKADWGV